MADHDLHFLEISPEISMGISVGWTERIIGIVVTNGDWVDDMGS